MSKECIIVPVNHDIQVDLSELKQICLKYLEDEDDVEEYSEDLTDDKLRHLYNHEIVDGESEILFPYEEITLHQGINVLQPASGISRHTEHILLDRIRSYCKSWSIPHDITHMKRFDPKTLMSHIFDTDKRYDVLEDVMKRTPAEQTIHMWLQLIERTFLGYTADHPDMDEYVVLIDDVDYGCSIDDICTIAGMLESAVTAVTVARPNLQLYVVVTSNQFEWVRRFGAINSSNGKILKPGITYEDYVSNSVTDPDLFDMLIEHLK